MSRFTMKNRFNSTPHSWNEFVWVNWKLPNRFYDQFHVHIHDNDIHKGISKFICNKKRSANDLLAGIRRWEDLKQCSISSLISRFIFYVLNFGSNKLWKFCNVHRTATDGCSYCCSSRSEQRTKTVDTRHPFFIDFVPNTPNGNTPRKVVLYLFMFCSII